jgi:hypothetical protein
MMRRARALDLRPHLVEEIGEVTHFRLRGPFDDGDASASDAAIMTLSVPNENQICLAN